MANSNSTFNSLPEDASFLELAMYYDEQQNYDLAENYYMNAFDDGEDFAAIYLGDLYNKQGEFELAEEWYRNQSGDDDYCSGSGNNALAHFLVEQGREEDAWKYLRHVLFIDDVDTAPYESAMLLVCELLGKGKYWDKIKDDTLYLVYVFLDSEPDEELLRFTEENLLKCIENGAPNARFAAEFLVNMYFCGKYTVRNYYGFVTDNVISAPALTDKEKGTSFLDTLNDEDLEEIAVHFDGNDDDGTLETAFELWGYVYNVLTDRLSDTPTELAEKLITELSYENITDERIAKLCGRIPNCAFWRHAVWGDPYIDEYFDRELSLQRRIAILEEVTSSCSEDDFYPQDLYYPLGYLYDSAHKYDKAIEAFEKSVETDGVGCEFAATTISDYYRNGRPGIPQCFKSALDWALVAFSKDEGFVECENLTGEKSDEKKGMWEELLRRAMYEPTTEIADFFITLATEFEEYYTSEEYAAALTSLAEFGNKRAEEAIKHKS